MKKNGSFVFKLETPWIPGSSVRLIDGPRMTILNGRFCLSFPQVLSGNPVSLMSISTFLRMNLNFRLIVFTLSLSSYHKSNKLEILHLTFLIEDI